MATLLHCILIHIISIFTLCSSQSTTLSPNQTDIFAICTKLKLAGCALNEIDTFIRSYVDGSIQDQGYNWSLPLDPCLYSTVNMTWVLSVSDLSLLDLITGDQVIDYMPCELYVQMPSAFLDDRNLSMITGDDYWFGDNGHCIYNESLILDCSDPNRTTNYSASTECSSPFVASSYETEYLPGQPYCSVPCDLYFYGGDVKVLDDFNYAVTMIALFLSFGFFCNTAMEIRKKVKEKKKKFRDLPLHFDIPIIIAVWLLVLNINLLIPHWAGKEYFACEVHGKGEALTTAPTSETNPGCFVSGQFVYLSIMSMYLYFALLSFSVWRSIYDPFKPLWGIHKIWFHLGINCIVISFWIGTVVDDVYGAINVLGSCGPNITGWQGEIYTFIPLLFVFALFFIFTPLTLYEIWGFYKKQKHTEQEKSIAQLAIRLVIYSVFVAASLCCFLYLVLEFVYEYDEWSQHIADYLICGFENDLSECTLVLSIDDNVYFMEGILVFLISIASFSLSCNNQRFSEYNIAASRLKSRTQSTVNLLRTIGSSKRLDDISIVKRTMDDDEMQSTTKTSQYPMAKSVTLNTKNLTPIPANISHAADDSYDNDGGVEMTEQSAGNVRNEIDETMETRQTSDYQ